MKKSVKLCLLLSLVAVLAVSVFALGACEKKYTVLLDYNDATGG